MIQQQVAMDDDDFTISILGSLSSQQMEQVEGAPCDCRCVFNKEADCQDEDYFIPCEQQYIMEIKDQYLVEISPKSAKIIGGIKLSLDFRFQIKRLFCPFSSELAEPFAFVLEFPEENEEQIVIKIGVDNDRSEELQKFAACLETKPIMQLDMHQNFKINQRLSITRTACVYLATHFRTNKQFAIKCMKKDMFAQTGRTAQKALKREYLIPFYLNHPNICKFAGLFDSETTIYLVMEFFPMNFLEFVSKRGIKSAEEFRRIFKLICEAVEHLHDRGIMHRDIKLQNIMMRKIGEDDDYEPVLIDFGVAEYEGKLPYIFTRCGTLGYTAPEVIHCDKEQPTYTCKCDVFSLGSLFYCLLLKKPLFNAKKMEEVIQKNKKCEIDENDPQFMLIHKNARQLLFGMLKRDPNQRFSIKQVLQHSFFVEEIQTYKPQATHLQTQRYELVRSSSRSDTE